MNILDDFISDNRRIEILSNGGNPLQIPTSWGNDMTHPHGIV